jgi:beta-lactamase superfamily II metal-dependent hydrolase
MRAECQFAKAGQGLFYNCLLINDQRRTFSFVYDCGTLTSSKVLSNSITEYKQIAGKNLDLLVLSHFHQDHVSHIPELIKDMELGTVIIPFVNPELRLLLAAQNEGIESNVEQILLYSNPIEFFYRHGADKVITIQTVGEDEGFFSENPENFFRNNETQNDNIGEYFSILGHKLNCEQKQDQSIPENCYRGTIKIFSKIFDWEFRLVNANYDDLKDNFWHDIKELLKKFNNNFYNILSNKLHIKELREVYNNNYMNSLNYTSLLLLSYPTGNGIVVDANHNNKSCQYNYKTRLLDCIKFCGEARTLLTGDIMLDTKTHRRYADDLSKNLYDLPRVIQIPHHGAKFNNNDFIHAAYKHSCIPASFVISYGILNKYGHPYIGYFRSCDGCLQQPYRQLILVNERQDYCYTVFYA